MKVRFSIPKLQAHIKKIGFVSKGKMERIRREVVMTATEIQADAKETVHVDTGRLRGSIDMSSSLQGFMPEAEVGSNVEYAGYHEAQYPYLTPAAKKRRAEFLRRIQKIVSS